MNRKLIVSFVGISVLSLLTYSLLFFFIFKKPMTIGEWFEMYKKKESYARAIGSQKKIVLVAGSNGVYSHSCAEMEKAVGLKCLNAATGVGLGIKFILEKSKEFISPGDIVILPLEYNFYTYSQQQVTYASLGNNYIAQYERGYLLKLGRAQILPILFSFNFQYLFSSAVELGLNAVGFKRRSGAHALNANGDMVNHTKEKGLPYRSYIYSVGQEMADEALLTHTAFASQAIIADFLNWCRQNNVAAFGAFPTTFDDRKNNPEALKKIKDLYYDSGAGFIETGNDSQYGRECFYDTAYHLNQEYQILHSRKIADYLRRSLPGLTALPEDGRP